MKITNAIFSGIVGLVTGSVMVISVMNLLSGHILAGLVGLGISFVTVYVMYRKSC